MSEGAERRKYHRIGTDQVISFAEVDHPNQRGLSKNLSTGGIRFEAVGCEINLGETLRVTFNLGSQTVVATGTVVWATASLNRPGGRDCLDDVTNNTTTYFKFSNFLTISIESSSACS